MSQNNIYLFLRYPVVVLFHSIPLLPLYWQRPMLVIACGLLVSLPYIKVKKLGVQYQEAVTHNSSEAAAIYKTKCRWQWLTINSLTSSW